MELCVSLIKWLQATKSKVLKQTLNSLMNFRLVHDEFYSSYTWELRFRPLCIDCGFCVVIVLSVFCRSLLSPYGFVGISGQIVPVNQRLKRPSVSRGCYTLGCFAWCISSDMQRNEPKVTPVQHESNFILFCAINSAKTAGWTALVVSNDVFRAISITACVKLKHQNVSAGIVCFMSSDWAQTLWIQMQK